MLKKTIHHLARQPRKLFLADSLGAALSTGVLVSVLSCFSASFAIPERALICLVIPAAVLCICSMACFLFLKDNYAPFIGAIALANLLYCMLTVLLLLRYLSDVTSLAVMYFSMEAALIGGLVYIELSVMKRLKESQASQRQIR